MDSTPETTTQRDDGVGRGCEVLPSVKRCRATDPLTTTSTTTTQSTCLASNQWLLRRQNNSGDDNTIVLMEHLGDASAMVESLTHQVDSWSLLSAHHPSRDTTRIKASKRAIMRALLSLSEEEQKTK